MPVLSIGTHDGIGATVKLKVYQETMSGRIVIENAQQFASEADSLCSIKGRYQYRYYQFREILKITRCYICELPYFFHHGQCLSVLAEIL